MSDNDAKRSSVVQGPPVGFLDISGDDWAQGVTLNRWARQRDEDAFHVVSRNAFLVIEEEPNLVYRYLDRNDSPNDHLDHVAAHRRLRDLLLDDLRKRRCVLGVPPQLPVESATPVSQHNLKVVIRRIIWGIGPPVSSFGHNLDQGVFVKLRLYPLNHFGEVPSLQAAVQVDSKSGLTQSARAQAERAEPWALRSKRAIAGARSTAAWG